MIFFQFQITYASVSIAFPQPGKMAKAISFEITFAQKESHSEKVALAQQISQIVEKTQIKEPSSSNSFSFTSQIPG